MLWVKYHTIFEIVNTTIKTLITTITYPKDVGRRQAIFQNTCCCSITKVKKNFICAVTPSFLDYAWSSMF